MSNGAAGAAAFQKGAAAGFDPAKQQQAQSENAATGQAKYEECKKKSEDCGATGMKNMQNGQSQAQSSNPFG